MNKETSFFARAFVQTWPEGRHLLKSLKVRKNQALLVRNVPASFNTETLTIVKNENENDTSFGTVCAKVLRDASSGKANPDIRKMQSSINAIVRETQLPVHSMTLERIVPHMGRTLGAFAIELTEIGDMLENRIKTYSIEDDRLPLGTRELGGCDLKRFTDWCKGQQKLRDQRKSGLLIDPVLKSIMTDEELAELIAVLRQPRSHYSGTREPFEDIRLRGVAMPKQVESVYAVNGVIHSKIKLAKDIVWTSGEKYRASPSIEFQFDDPPPASMIARAHGRNISYLLEHPWIKPDWKITEIKQTPGFAGIAKTRIEVLLECSMELVQSQTDS